MSKEIVFLVEASAEGGFEARAQGYAIFTYADTLDELQWMVEDAVACHFDEGERPESVVLQECDRN